MFKDFFHSQVSMKLECKILNVQVNSVTGFLLKIKYFKAKGICEI